MSNELTKSKYLTPRAVVALLLIIAWVAIILVMREYAYSKSLMNIALLIAFVFTYIQLPGFILLRFFGMTFKSKLTKYPVGFFIGLFAIFAEYYFCALIGHIGAIVFLNPVITIILIAAMIKKKAFAKNDLKAYIPSLKGIDITFIIFAMIVFVVSIIRIRLFFMGSLSTDTFASYPDFLYHVGLSNSLSQGYPLASPTVGGEIISYHFFMDMFNAIAMKVTGISADKIIFSFAPYLLAYVFGTSTYAMFAELTKKTKFAGLYSILMILPGFTLLGMILQISDINRNWFIFGHTMTNINAVGISISAFMVLIILMQRMISEKNKAMVTVMVCMFVVLITGLKSPFGVLAVLFVCMTLLFDAITSRRICLWHLLAGAAVAVCALAIYFFVISGIQFGTDSSDTSRRDVQFVLMDGMKNTVTYQKLNELSVADSIAIPLGFISSILLRIGFWSLPFICAIVTFVKRGLIKRNRRYMYMLGLAATSMGSMFIGYFTKWAGDGQGYFLFVAFPIFTLLALIWLEERAHVRVLRTLSIILLFIGAVASVYAFGTTIIKNAESGVLLAKVSSFEEPEFVIYNEATMIYKEERAAMIWISKHTKEGAMFATNNYDYKGWYNRRFYYSAFSKRRFYLEGYAYSNVVSIPEKLDWMKSQNAILFGSSNAERLRVAHELDVNYLVVYKKLECGLKKGSKHFKLKYSNEYISVYKVVD